MRRLHLIRSALIDNWPMCMMQPGELFDIHTPSLPCSITSHNFTVNHLLPELAARIGQLLICFSLRKLTPTVGWKWKHNHNKCGKVMVKIKSVAVQRQRPELVRIMRKYYGKTCSRVVPFAIRTRAPHVKCVKHCATNYLQQNLAKQPGTQPPSPSLISRNVTRQKTSGKLIAPSAGRANWTLNR